MYLFRKNPHFILVHVVTDISANGDKVMRSYYECTFWGKITDKL